MSVYAICVHQKFLFGGNDESKYDDGICEFNGFSFTCVPPTILIALFSIRTS